MKSMLILGSGQLGLMMAEAAVKYGVVVDRYELNSDELIYASSQTRVQQTNLAQTLDQYDIISAELEHLPDNDAVRQIKAASNWANVSAFEVLPTRHTQKAFLDDIQVPTAPWQKIEHTQQLTEAFTQLGNTLVFKTVAGGYDGKGQWVLARENIKELPQNVIGAVIAEKKIDFDFEVSLIGARNKKGDFYFYPLTRNFHDEGILRFSIAPVSHLDLQAKAEEYLKKIMNSLDYEGVMGMECFAVGDELCINELAPRVHNSGHWTQLGATYNQFDLHVRALSGIKLPVKQSTTPTIMLNLIGCDYSADWWQIDEIDVHWYGKEKRPARKLGHINFYVDWCRDKDNQAKVLRTLDESHQRYFQMALEEAL